MIFLLNIIYSMKKVLFAFLLLAVCGFNANAQTMQLIGPAGSGQFGRSVILLTNGNYVFLRILGVFDSDIRS